MKLGARLAKSVAVLLGAGMLTACLAPAPTLKPQARPAGLAPAPAARPAASGPSAKRLELEAYYAKVQNNYLVKGLYRTDGGGPEERFTATDLLRNFSRIAFHDEYELGLFRDERLSDGASQSYYMRRWERPVRVGIVFGSSVANDRRQVDQADIMRFTSRLARITKHPIGMAPQGSAPNFHVLVMSEDDKPELLAYVNRLVPNPSQRLLSWLRNPPRTAHCLALTWPSPDNETVYHRALILIRAEHPHLGRQACLHEEMAQGLGLRKDSKDARPSIFNDDEEFAFLTTHDEMLLKMLYDPRLRPGMTFEQARPTAMQIATELTGNRY